MGNAPSKGEKSGSAPQSPSPQSSAATQPSHAPHGSTNHGPSHQASVAKNRSQPRRKESIHTLSVTASVKPSPSLESATAKPSSTSTSRSAADSLRSQGIGQPIPVDARTPRLRPADSQDPEGKMGNKESKPVDDKRDRSPSRPTSPKPIDKATPAPAILEKASDHSAIVAASRSLPLPEDDYSLPPASYSFSRPPRLPLPIEEEVYTPGSPVITPLDAPAAVEPIEGDGELDKTGRQTSMLSSTTVDDDEIPDDVVFQDSAGQPLVPTLIEWRQGGDRVYVTGTFVDWDKKVRLHRNGPSKHKDAFSAFINLPPGTHHCRFIVDGDLRLSNDLPTAVDFTNFLTNYIEVAPPATTAPKPSVPVDIPLGPKAPPQQPSSAGKPEYRAPPGVHPPQVLPPTPELVPISRPPPPEKKKEESLEDKDPASRPATLAHSPPKSYHRSIPSYLLDLDLPEDHPKLSYANAVVSTLPSPPTLPMFLAKSILNGATPMKDDASVLIMPNHTVLNHLATSSIRQKVLATSATTRYKRKFLTTIMYKPTSEVGD